MTLPNVTENRRQPQPRPFGTSSSYEIRRMDCIDCHNRPAHRYSSPDDAVNLAIALGHLDRGLPYIKTNAVYALTRPYGSETEARDGTATFLENRYSEILAFGRRSRSFNRFTPTTSSLR